MMRSFVLLSITASSVSGFIGAFQKRSRHHHVRIQNTATGNQIETLIENGDLDSAIRYMEQTESVSPSLGAKLLNAAVTLEPYEIQPTNNNDKTIRDPIGGGLYEPSDLAGPVAANKGSNARMVSPLQEQRLVQCYTLLKEKISGVGLFGSADMNALPLPSKGGCSIEQLEMATELPLSAFRPNLATANLYWLGGAAACALEVLLSRALHISPQPLFFATFAAGIVDQALGGGASEKIMWTLNPSQADRVLRHEAGHLLVAHMLGCPVQSVSLGAWDALTKSNALDGNSGGIMGAGTSFFDPELNAASLKGRVTRSVVDRYSVVVMAGIAAEALCFGDSEGGSDDERALQIFLSQTVQTNVNIPEQARWAATNALLLLRGQKEAYERLVTVLQNKGSRDIGQIIMALEGYDVDSTVKS